MRHSLLLIVPVLFFAPAAALSACSDDEGAQAVNDAGPSVNDAGNLDGAVSSMTFFVTSRGSGNGGNLGGLDGADAHCTLLANAVGATGHTWRAYLSTTSAGGAGSSVDAKSRIGQGPWRNAKGVVVATSVDNLHSDTNNLTKETSITETGAVVNGRGDTPNEHDVLTGSNTDGTAAATNCANWTSNAETGVTGFVGHHDRRSITDAATCCSWNSSHETTGCSQTALVGTGGSGRFYCFAAD